MANQDAAFGLRPFSKIDGSSLGNLVQEVYLPSSYATAVFVGTAVKRAADSNAAAVTGFIGGDRSAGTIPEVTLSAAGESIDYVITGFVPTADDGMGTADGAASTERIAIAIPVKDVIFEIQSSGSSFTVTDMHNAADLASTGGNATSGISTSELDTTYGTTGQLTVVGISKDPNNEDIASANVNLLVTVRESNLFAAVAAL
jgi:hypothetical protein